MMAISKERLQAVSAIRDEDLDYSDIPETDESFWSQAAVRMPEATAGLYVRLDQDLLDWLKRDGPTYHSKVNAILRSYMESHQS